MAPVDHPISNTKTLLSFGAQGATALSLTGYVAYILVKASRALPPSAETRARQTKRKRDITIFSVLSVVSFSLLSYFAANRRWLSYQAWAHDSSQVPGNIWSGWYATDPAEKLQLGKWSEDINLGREWTDLALGTTRGFWWSLSWFTGLTAWSIFLGVETRQRNIPMLTTVALILIASSVGLSFAQSLFSILLLLTPVPLPFEDGTRPKRGPAWSPNPIAFALFSVTAVIANLLLPAFTQGLPPTSLIPYAACAYPVLFAILVQHIPVSWGTAHSTPHAAKRSYSIVFSAISFTSTLIYWFMTVLTLFENAPEARLHRYNYVWNTHSKHSLTPLQRLGHSITTVLSVLSKHPAIAGVAWDVVLSAVVLTTWASARDLDPRAMLKSSVAPFIHADLPTTDADHPTVNGTNAVKTKGSKTPAAKLLPSTTAADDDTLPLAVKKGGKTGTLGRSTRSGRSAKDATDDDAGATTAPAPATASRRSTRHKKSKSTDSEYKPTEAEKDAVDAVAHEDEAGEESLAEEAEAAALGWGLFVLTGLGSMTAGVLGAEVTGR